jgi:hypothetical protein
MLALTLLALPSCDLLDSAIKEVEKVTNPLVGQGLFLGLEPPDDPEIEAMLSDMEDAPDSVFQVFLADAASASELDQAPIEGASVSVRVGNTAAVTVVDEGSGSYKAYSEDGISYIAGSEAMTTMDIAGEQSQFWITLPAAANATVPEEMDPGTPLQVSLGEFEFDAVLGVVMNVATGNVTWDNRPESIQDIYDFTHAEEAQDSLTIPGTAFQGQSLFAVGIAGLRVTDSESYDNMNTVLSSFMAGRMRFYLVSTIQLP